MTQRLGWGQALGSVAQIAYVVRDLDAAMAHCQRDLGSGPCFVIENFLQAGQIYRGQESRADMRIAMTFAGQTWIELIQPLDQHPSVYRETIESRGYGLHHHGIAFTDVAAALADYQARGWQECFRSPVPTGGDVVFLQGGHADAPAFIELLPVTPGMDAHFTSLWRAAQDWDGADPVRPFI